MIRLDRLMVFALVALAFGWSWWAFLSLRGAESLHRVAQKVLAGEHYEADYLEGLVRGVLKRGDEVYAPCLLDIDHDRIALLTRLAEEKLRAGRGDDFQKVGLGLERESVRLLKCSPHRSFAWMALYWVQNTLHGFDPERLSLLAMSYDTGAYEGWVAVRRNRLSSSVVSLIPDAVIEKIRAETLALQEAQFLSLGQKASPRRPWEK